MRAYRLFLELCGAIFLSTITHELWNLTSGTHLVIGFQFGNPGGAFVDGYNLPWDGYAFIVQGIVLALLTGLLFIKRTTWKSRERSSYGRW